MSIGCKRRRYMKRHPESYPDYMTVDTVATEAQLDFCIEECRRRIDFLSMRNAKDRTKLRNVRKLENYKLALDSALKQQAAS